MKHHKIKATMPITTTTSFFFLLTVVTRHICHNLAIQKPLNDRGYLKKRKKLNKIKYKKVTLHVFCYFLCTIQAYKLVYLMVLGIY